MNRFEYARSDPSNKADPDGLREVRIYWIVERGNIPPNLNYTIPSNGSIQTLLINLIWEPCFQNLKCDRVKLFVKGYEEGFEKLYGMHYMGKKPWRYIFGINYFANDGKGNCGDKDYLAYTGGNNIADIHLWHIYNQLSDIENEDPKKYYTYLDHMDQLFANIFAHEGLWHGALGKWDPWRDPPGYSLKSNRTDYNPLKITIDECKLLKELFQVE